MIADNFFDDKIVRVTIKNNFMYLYMLTCVRKYLIIHFRQKKSVSPPPPPPPPPEHTLFNIVPWAQCCGEYSDILCHMHTVVWDTNPMGVQCMYTEDQFFGGMMHVHDIELYVGTCSYECVCVCAHVCLCVCCVCACRVCIACVYLVCAYACLCMCVSVHVSVCTCVCAFRVCVCVLVCVHMYLSLCVCLSCVCCRTSV